MIAALVGAMVLSGCGDNPLSRGLSGAAIGAGAAAATDNDVATGAAIGGGVGVLSGL